MASGTSTVTVPRFTKETLFDVSDKYRVNVCKKCGMIAVVNNGDSRRF